MILLNLKPSPSLTTVYFFYIYRPNYFSCYMYVYFIFEVDKYEKVPRTEKRLIVLETSVTYFYQFYDSVVGYKSQSSQT